MNRQFRNKYGTGIPLTREQAERQGRAVRGAWEGFAAPGAALAFLNSFNDELGGRPIDLAVASAAGLAAVEQAIAAQAG
jgi:hypothetical protein